MRDCKALWRACRNFIDLADVIPQSQASSMILCEADHSVNNVGWPVLSLEPLNQLFRENCQRHLVHSVWAWKPSDSRLKSLQCHELVLQQDLLQGEVRECQTVANEELCAWWLFNQFYRLSDAQNLFLIQREEQWVYRPENCCDLSCLTLR